MSNDGEYVVADPTNLPRVNTFMLFDFFKNGRKFHCVEFDIDKENFAINNYGDDFISNVCLMRADKLCVVKASTAAKQKVRVIINEKLNIVCKIQCKNCLQPDCIHAFALLMWLHRRTEDSAVDQTKWTNIISAIETVDCLNDSYSTYGSEKSSSSNQHSPNANQYSLDKAVLKSSPNPKIVENSVDVKSSNTQPSKNVYDTDQHTLENAIEKSSPISELAEKSIDEALFSQPISYSLDTVDSKQEILMDTTSTKTYSMLQICRSNNITRECIETENSVSVLSLPSKVLPLSEISNLKSAISPKQQKTVRKTPYSQKTVAIKNSKKQSVLSKKISILVKQPKIDNFFIKPKLDVEEKPQLKHLYMGELMKNFLKLKKAKVEDFMPFAEKQMTQFLCEEAEKLTRTQRTDLWMALRYGRITASIIHEAACCRTMNGSLVNKILGKCGNYQSPSMKRGIDLESDILRQVEIKENIITSSSGLFLVPECPIIGASPDAIGSDFIVEIKAPSSDSTFQNFLPNGMIAKKYLHQMYLQMYCTGMKRGVFCVADPDFEKNKIVTTVWLAYDEEFTKTLEKAKMFWFEAIFTRLLNLC